MKHALWRCQSIKGKKITKKLLKDTPASRTISRDLRSKWSDYLSLTILRNGIHNGCDIAAYELPLAFLPTFSFTDCESLFLWTFSHYLLFFSLTTNKNTLDFITRTTYVGSILSGTVLILPLSTSQEKKKLFSTHIFPPLTSSPPFLFFPPFFSLSLHSLPLTPPPTLPPLTLEFMFPLKMNFLLSQLIFSDYK